MKKRLERNRLVYIVLGVVAVAATVALYLAGAQQAAVVGFAGVLVGSAATAVPQALDSANDRLRRTRAASVLFRSELYAYQNWIAQSLKDSRWAPAPSHIATPDHLADLAYALPEWADWQKVGRARRLTNELVGLSERSQPDTESRKHAWRTFTAINEVRVILAALDDGETKPHWATEDVRLAIALAAAKKRRWPFRR